jgi:hypothetical protein
MPFLFNKWGHEGNVNQIPFPLIQVFKNIKLSAPKLYLDPGYLRRKYVEERLSAAEIATQCFSSKAAVLSSLKRNGIQVRGSGKNIRRVRNIAFGRRISDRREVVHKREQELITKMKALRAEGLSYWKIAGVLNAWDIPTKTRKGKWSAKQVHQILNRAVISTM